MHYTGKSNKENNIVYMYTNKVNSKVYIGRTMRSVSARAGLNGNGYKTCTKFWHAICKYGWDSFELTILAEHISYDESVQLEKYYIQKYRSDEQDYGYNLLKQEPNRGSIPQEVRDKISKARKNFSPEMKAKLAASHFRGNIPWNKGIKTGPLTEEQKKNFSEARKGNKNSIHVSVKDLTTGEVFRSGAEAGRSINRTSEAVFWAIKHGKPCNGHFFERINK